MDSMFIVVEGIDGSGTTTCSKLLTKELNRFGTETLWTKQPSDGTIGRHIRRVLRGEEWADEKGMFPLFLADLHDHVASIIRPHLKQGDSIVCDRYFGSTWVYQQDSYEPFLIEYMQRFCLPPDIVFVLVCPVDEAMRRLGDRDVVERYEKRESQEIYYDRYLRIPRMKDELIIYLDSFGTKPEKIVRRMLEEISLLVQRS